jgi:DNA-binding NarL/FixJ family response regulator
VRTVRKGGGLIEPGVAKRVMAEFARLHPPARKIDEGLPEPLSERELEVLRLVSAGLSNREIGHKLGLSEGTVKNYVTSMLQKIGVRDRTQAALRGRELGLI